MKHIRGLDGLRGFALLMVLLFHTTYLDRINAIDEAAFRFTRCLDFGVDLFFVLSGFLITNVLMGLRNSEKRWTVFYARRTVRIFPLYYAVVGAVVLGAFLFPQLENYDLGMPQKYGLPYWLYLSNVWQSGPHPVLGVAWSLAIEEQFYLVWPFVVFACTRLTLRKVCWCMIVLGVVWRAVTAYAVPLPMLPFARADLLCGGALIATYYLDGRVQITRQKIIPMVGIALAVLLGLGIMNDGPWGESYKVFGRAAFGVLCIAWLIRIVNRDEQGSRSWVVDNAFMRTFGKYSYAMYFFHSPIDAVFRRLIDIDKIVFPIAGTEIPMQIVYTCLVGAVTLFFSIISWYAFESQFLKLKKYFPRPQDRVPTSGFAEAQSPKPANSTA